MNSKINNGLDNEQLLEAMRKSQPLTKEQRREQMVSFIMGDMKDYPKTEKEREQRRDEIRKRLEESAW